MILRNATLDDYEYVVDMYYDFYSEVYTDRDIGKKYFFYKEVIGWINSKKDIIVADRDGVVVGFSLSYIDYNGGLTDAIYSGDIAYVKKEHRKTRAAYMLYKNVSEYAKDKELTLVANGLATTGVSDMIRKHFDCKEMFNNFERKHHG